MPEELESSLRRREDDRRFDRFEKDLGELRSHVDKRFDGVHLAIASLAFVRTDVYEAHRSQLLQSVADAKKFADDKVEAVREIAESARAFAMRTFMVLAGAVVVALVALLFRVAGG